MSILAEAANRILPALITPLTPDGQLDERSLERLIDHLYARGVGGLYVTGSTGEGVHLDFAVRQRIVEIAVERSRGKGQVIAHVGAAQSAKSYELAIAACRAGADAVASIPPAPGTFEWSEVLAYYRRLADVSSVPVVGYYIPLVTVQRFSLDQLAEMMALPNVAGLKFTDPDIYLMERLVKHARADQIIYNGPDQTLALGLSMGAHGGIGSTYNFQPELILKVAELVAGGRLEEAVAAQKLINDVIEIMFEFPMLAATKQVLYWQGLLDSPAMAPPRLPMTKQQCEQLHARLQSTSLAASLVKSA